MGTLNEDLSAIKEVEDKIVANKVARFAYTDEAYKTNDADGVDEYDVDNAQNIPTADASVLKVNETVLSKGYRAQASSITRMLVNHFFGRMSYNLNKVNDNVSNLIATLIGHRGTANGFATLDENGRVPYSQLPESAMEYKGQWNAETNTPALADGTGTKGDFYIVSVSGTQNLGSGNVQYFENDRIIYDGSVWSRLSAGDVKAVNSVLPANGNVALTGENIPVSPTDPTLLSAPLTTDRYADSSVTNAKIKDPVSVAKGGTGATGAKDAFTNLANGLSEASNPQDAEYMIYRSGTDWGLYTFSTFWGYIKDKISSVLGLTKDNYGGKAATASLLAPYEVRPSSGNIVPKDSSEYGAMRKDLVTSKMIDIGLNRLSGHLLTMFWDSSSRWDTQLFITNDTGVPLALKLRQKQETDDYGDWVEAITSNNIGSQTVASAGTATTADKVKNALTINGQSFDGSSPVTLNISSGTDTKVYQNVSRNDNTYPILASATANKSTSGTEEAIITSLLCMNPATGNMTGWSNGSAYAICAVDSYRIEKVVELPGLTLTRGMTLTVLFTGGNRAVAPKLNVNYHGAKPIKVYLAGGKTTVTTQWDAGTSMTLMYDGTDFVVLGNPVVMSNLSSSDGYIKYANGLLIQWGRVEQEILNDKPYEVIFPIAYTNKPTVIATFIVPENYTARGNIVSITETQFKLMCGDHTTHGYTWMSIGR